MIIQQAKELSETASLGKMLTQAIDVDGLIAALNQSLVFDVAENSTHESKVITRNAINYYAYHKKSDITYLSFLKRSLVKPVP